MIAERLLPGAAYPLGATWDGLGTNFAVFSANAAAIDLCVFDPSGKREIARLRLPECTDEVWHGYLPDAHPGMLYGFRAHGPYQPQHGHRFNPHKLLLDPYAKQLSGPLRWSDALFGYRMHSSRSDASFDRRDSAAAMPKAVVTAPSIELPADHRPQTPWSHTVIYEAHVRGVSMTREDVMPPQRGTFAGLASPKFIEHLSKIGVTAIELMPVHAFLQDRFLVEKRLRNYWGYSTLSFFAPEPGYLSFGSGAAAHASLASLPLLDEIRLAVRKLHEAGIEVLLDVVFNHTCEGNALGPTLSWRGLDNASYYRLIPGNERHYIDETGCGNTVNLSHPRVLQMVMDSLRYWAEAFHIDGYRFDLGVTLGREGHGFDPGSGFFDAVRQDPVLSRLKLISEPWDVGPDGYQLGGHPPGFAEWNDRFRDSARRLWRGDEGQRPELAARLTGSADLFNRRRRRPWASINYVASHDGFTATDLTRYTGKHNEANGEDNRDGHNDNCSANWGVEGPSDDPVIRAQRGRILRALLAMPFVSLGTPMLTAGDEFGRTQDGNNNAYCQDTPLSWLDWSLADTDDGQALTDYVASLAALRRACPLLRDTRFLDGSQTVAMQDAGQRRAAADGPADNASDESANGTLDDDPANAWHDVDWFDVDGQPMSIDAWNDVSGRTLVCRRAGLDDEGRRQALLIVINAADVPVDVVLPGSGNEQWHALLVTAEPALPPVSALPAESSASLAAARHPAGAPIARHGRHYACPAHALSVLALV